MAHWYILWQFGIFYGHLVCFSNLVYFMVIWYIFPIFGMMYKETSGNPVNLRQTFFATVDLLDERSKRQFMARAAFFYIILPKIFITFISPKKLLQFYCRLVRSTSVLTTR
jgi:hypothetical protein